jgi:hypothetical protein
MKVALIAILALAALIIGFIAWRLWATYTGGGKAYRALAARIEPVEQRLVADQDPDPADLERFARDRETRKVLYDALEHHGRLRLFPSRWCRSRSIRN